MKDREIELVRLINAPRERVFAAWTDPLQVMRWWGPKGFTTTMLEMDVRPGGTWRFIMHGPDGVDYPNQIVYDEVLPNRRLVYAHNSGPDDPDQFQTTVTFEDRGRKTELTMRAVFSTAAARARVVKNAHAIEGGNQTLDRLEQYLAA